MLSCISLHFLTIYLFILICFRDLSFALPSHSFPSVRSPAGSYWVIDIADDYAAHSLVWSCKSVLGLEVDFAWVLSRNSTMSDETLAQLLTTFQSLTGYDAPAHLSRTVQGCN